MVAMVLLDRPVSIDIDAVIGAIRKRHPTLAVEPDSSSGEVNIISCDGQRIVFMNMDVRIPHDEDGGGGVWARATLTWPDALAAEQSHQAHVIVTTMGQNDALRDARLVTAAAGGLIEATPGSTAVVWDARIARSAELFLNDSLTALDEQQPPILSWFDVTPVRTASGFDVVTFGLASFIGREIEWPVGQRGEETLGLVANLACYLVLNGDVIKDGDTIGQSDNERIRVRHAISTNTEGLPILRIEVTN